MQLFFIALTLTLLSCQLSSVKNPRNSRKEKSEPSARSNSLGLEFKYGPQVGNYIVEIFEDSRGDLWFGTLSKGVAKYDGDTLRYFTKKDGLSGNAVVSMVEDSNGNLWFGTHSGLSKYNGSSFINYGIEENLCHNRLSTLMIDQHDHLWIGTWGGVCRLDLNNEDASLTNLILPVPDVTVPKYQETKEWVTDLLEDKNGDIWITRSGYSVCKYSSDNKDDVDPSKFTVYTKSDGLPSNCAQTIYEDKEGKIWIGCRVAEHDDPEPYNRTGDGGLCVYDSPEPIRTDHQMFKQFPNVPGLSKNDVYTIYGDKSNNTWIAANRTGLYRYDGQKFDLYTKTDRPDVLKDMNGIQSMLEDSRGTFWIGCSGGLFRLEDETFVNVTQYGPWK